jgi:hypothetical protein
VALPETNLFTTSIADTATDSTEVDITGYVPVGFFLPASFDGTALKFKAAPTLGGTKYVINDGAGDLSLTVAASKYIGVDPAKFRGVRYLTLTAGTSQSGATSGIIIVVKQDA